MTSFLGDLDLLRANPHVDAERVEQIAKERERQALAAKTVEVFVNTTAMMDHDRASVARCYADYLIELGFTVTPPESDE